jgi:PEP-CTERM motif
MIYDYFRLNQTERELGLGHSVFAAMPICVRRQFAAQTFTIERSRMKKISAFLAGAAMVATAAVSAHATTFAGFVEDGAGANISWTETGTTGGNLTASAPVFFTFDLAGLSTTPVLATLTLNGTSTTGGTVSDGDIIQGGINGTFTLTSATPFHGTTDLLNGTFSGAQIVGPSGGSTTSVQDSVSIGSVTYTSGLAKSLLTFGSDTSGNSFSLSGDALTNLMMNGTSLASFQGAFTGDFAATNAVGPTGVPEPATWAMMLVGASAVGGVLRRSRRTSLALA